MEAVLCIEGHVVASWVSTHIVLVALPSPSCDDQKYFQNCQDSLGGEITPNLKTTDLEEANTVKEE